MGVQHKQQRRFAIGRIPQDDYLTPNAVDEMVELVAKDGNIASYSVATQDNSDHSTGHEQATEQWLMSHDTAREFEIDCSSEQVGRALLLAFGAVVTDQPDAVNAAIVYRHVFSPMDVSTTRQLPATTLVEQLAAALDRRFPSMVAESFGLRGDGIERIAATLGLRGSGKYLTPSGVTIDDLLGLYYFYNSQASLEIDDAGVVTNYGSTKRLNSWEFGVANELILDDGYRPGAGLYQTVGDPASGAVRAECLVGKRSYTMGFNARFNSEADELAALRAQKPLKPKVQLIGPKITGVGEIQTITFNATPAAGNYTIGVTRGGSTQTTGNVAWNDVAGAIQTAVQALSNVGAGNATVGKVGNVITITLTGALAGENIAPVIFTSVGLQDAGAAAVNGVVAMTRQGTSYNHSLTIDGAKAPYETVELGERNGFVVMDVRPKLLFDVTTDKVATVTLINTTQSYTV